MNLRKKIESLVRIGLLVFVLAAVAFLSGITAMRFAIRGREVTMPNLTGKTLINAQQTLLARGLNLKVVDRNYSEFPANVVTRQSPPAGEEVKVSQVAHVVISLGPQNVTIPTLVGQSARVARIQLLQSGLQVGEVTSYGEPEMPADTVLQQNPGPGTHAASLRVNLLVSEGQPQSAYVMPHLVGTALLEAGRQLSSAGLKTRNITFNASALWPKGTIIAQTPDSGSKVTPDNPIDLVVAQ